MADLDETSRLIEQHPLLLYRGPCLGINENLVLISPEATEANADAFIKIVSTFKALLERLAAQPGHHNFILHQRNVRELEKLADAVTELCHDIGPTRDWSCLRNEPASEWEQRELIEIANRSSSKALLQSATRQAREEALLELQYELNEGRLESNVLGLIRDLTRDLQQKYKLPSPSEVPKWFIPAYDVVRGDDDNMFGVGSLHRGVMSTTGEQVIVETLHEKNPGEFDENTRNKFKKDMDDCYLLQHANLACIKGANHVASPPLIVYVCDTKENVLEYLERNNPPRATVWRLLYEAACGLEYIHVQKLVHGHLWLRSILVDSHGHARVASFGLVKTSAVYKPRHRSQTFRWKTYDVMDGEAPSAESDVYALAMCMIEAVTMFEPFLHLSDDEVKEKLKNHEIPRRPKDTKDYKGMADDEWNLVKAMTTNKPRCSITAAKDGLKKLYERSKPQEGVPAANIPDLIARLEANTNTTHVLQALYRHAEDEKSHQDMKERGYGALKKTVESADSSATGKLYAFAILDRRQRLWEPFAGAVMSKLKRFLVDENQQSLGSQATLDACLARLSSDQGVELLEACELLSCFAVSFEYLPSKVINPLSVLLKGTSDPTIKAAAADALGFFAITSLDPKDYDAIDESGAVESLVTMVRTGSNVEKVNALWALCCLTGDQARTGERVDEVSSEDSSSEFVHEIFEDEDVIASIVAYVASNEHNATDTKLALRLLGNIATSNSIRNYIVEQGALKTLAMFLRDDDTEKTHKNEQLKAPAAYVVSRLSQPSQLAVQIARDLPLTILIDLLAAKSGDHQSWVALALFRLADDVSVRAEMGDAIVYLMKGIQSSDATLKLYSVATLSTLAHDDDLCTRMVREGVIDTLTSTVSSFDLSEEKIKTYALLAIVRITRSTPALGGNTQAMAQAIMPLANLVHPGRDDSVSRDAVIETISRIAVCVSGLAKDTIDCAIEALLIAYRVGTDEQKRWAALGLSNMATTESVRENIFMKNADLIPSLMTIVRDDVAVAFHASALRGLVRVARRQPRALVESVVSSDNIVALKKVVVGVEGEQRVLAAELLYHLTTEVPKLKIMVGDLVGNALKQLSERGNDEEKVWATKALTNV